MPIPVSVGGVMRLSGVGKVEHSCNARIQSVIQQLAALSGEGAIGFHEEIEATRDRTPAAVAAICRSE